MQHALPIKVVKCINIGLLKISILNYRLLRLKNNKFKQTILYTEKETTF